jgi:gluconolactonase
MIELFRTSLLRVLLAAAGIVALSGCATSRLPSPVLAPGAQWESIPGIKFSFTEGVVAARDGTLYFVDMNRAGGTMYRYHPTTGVTEKVLEPSGMANGLHVDKTGDLLIAQSAQGGGRAIWRRNLATGSMTLLADSYQGKRLNSTNDISTDKQGHIYFTDVRYLGTEPIELPNAVYRIDPDRHIFQLATDDVRPNGIEVSPDSRRLYVMVCNVTTLPPNPLGPVKDRFGIPLGGVVAYDLSNKGEISNGRVFYRNDSLGVDGSAMDTDGNLYVVMHNEADNGLIAVVNPAGKVLANIAPPAGVAPTNLAFGRGSDSGTLYLTNGFKNGGGLYRIRTQRHGYYVE